MKFTLLFLILALNAIIYGQKEIRIEFVGDTSTKIFYSTGCQEADVIKVENRKYFLNKAEAENEGYKSENCTPAKTPNKNPGKNPSKQATKTSLKIGKSTINLTGLYSIETNSDKLYGTSFYVWGYFTKDPIDDACDPDAFAPFAAYFIYDFSNSDKYYYLLVDDVYKSIFENRLHETRGRGEGAFRVEFAVKNGKCFGLKVIKPIWEFEKID